MTVDVKVPRLAESISEAVLVEWLKDDGAVVRTDEAVATLETDKAAVEIAAPEAGVLHHARQAGERVEVGDVIARIEAGAASAKGSARAAGATPRGKEESPSAVQTATTAAAAPAPEASSRTEERGRPSAPPVDGHTGAPAPAPPADQEPALSPAVRRLVAEHGLRPGEIEATGKGGRLLKEDVLRHLERAGGGAAPEAPERSDVAGKAGAGPAPTPMPAPAADRAPPPAGEPEAAGTPDERVVPMSRIRQRIAERLVQAQQTAAILTTFNEIDMSAVLELRARYRESFEARHQVRLGFMGFFTRACVDALRDIPELNAEIRGTDIVYRSRIHMGIAVGTERGLVVPVVRDADRLGLAAIEREVMRLAGRARDGNLTLQELSGGTFTISNGGVYGSLLSTPILNPPQSGILGMHKIEKRPIAVDDRVVIRPMMYVALSYDHRIVDGEQAVTFLVRVKERVENPERMLLDV